MDSSIIKTGEKRRGQDKRGEDKTGHDITWWDEKEQDRQDEQLLSLLTSITNSKTEKMHGIMHIQCNY